MAPKQAAIQQTSWPLIDPGRLRNQIEMASINSVQDAAGQPLSTWSPYLTTWAEIRMLSGQELFQGDQFTSAAQYRITLRWPGQGLVNAGDHVLFGARVFVVQIVNDIYERNVLLELICLEIDGSS